MKDLQAIIDKKAVEKLRNELSGEGVYKFLEYMKVQDFLDLYSDKGKTISDKADWYFSSIVQCDKVREFIFQKKIPEYIAKESEKFIKEVDKLKSRVEDLNNDISYLQQ